MIERLTAALQGRYEIQRELGEGGMARVYLAQDVRHNRQVALKVMRPDYASAIGPERFLREIQFVARLQHPKVVPLFDSGEADGILFYTMPYIEGDTLRRRLQAERQLPVDGALRIAMDVCDALEHAASRGLVHRDIKPENILLSGGHALVMDFGIARQRGGTSDTATGMAVGTPAYASPEQNTADTVDVRSDIYSLGCMLFEMLVGTPPFAGATPQATMMRHAVDPPPPLRTVRPSVPAQVESAVFKALEKVPADRHQTPMELRRALEAGLEEFASGVRTPTPAARPAHRRPATKWWAVAGLAALTAFLGWWIGKSNPVGTTGGAPSIAVLAFTDRSEARNAEHLGDGIAEELILALSGVSDLRVAARTSAFSFKSKDVVVQQIGRELGVRNVLEGSVRRVGDSVQVDVNLMKAADGFPIWTHSVTAHLREIGDLKDLLASSILGKLGVTPSEEARKRLAGRSASSAEAYDEYLQGRFILNKRDTEMPRAIPKLQRAIALDPAYAPAHASLGVLYGLVGLYGVLPPLTVFPLARAQVDSALALDPDNAEALAALGLIKTVFEWDWNGARAAFRRSLQVSPNNPQTLGWLAMFQIVAERSLEPSMESSRRAIAVDPMAYVPRVSLAQPLLLLGRPNDAIVELEAAVAANPRSALYVSSYLLHAYALAGRWDEAYALAEEFVTKTGRTPLAVSSQGMLFARAGRMKDAERALAELTERSKRERVQPLTFSHLLVSMKRYDEAFAKLDEAITLKESLVLSLRLFPEFRNATVEADPRYWAILARTGLNLR